MCLPSGSRLFTSHPHRPSSKCFAPRSKAKWIDFFFSLSSSPCIQIFFFSSEFCAMAINPDKVVSDRGAVTHVAAGAKSEHSGRRDANTLEMCAGGFIVAYFIWNMAGACSDVYFARVNRDVLRRRAHVRRCLLSVRWFLPQKLVKMSCVVIQAPLKNLLKAIRHKRELKCRVISALSSLNSVTHKELHPPLSFTKLCSQSQLHFPFVYNLKNFNIDSFEKVLILGMFSIISPNLQSVIAKHKSVLFVKTRPVLSG